MLRITALLLTLLIAFQLHFKYQLPALVIYYYLGINFFTLCLYGYDKSAARKGIWRIPELHLHLLALFGGWGGALVAQQFIRHKSVKRPFLVLFNLSIVAHIALLIAVFNVL